MSGSAHVFVVMGINGLCSVAVLLNLSGNSPSRNFVDSEWMVIDEYFSSGFGLHDAKGVVLCCLQARYCLFGKVGFVPSKPYLTNQVLSAS